MKLPEQYQNLTIEEKRIVVANLISEFWDQKIQWLADRVWDAQIEFLFNYFFTESKEEREKMRNEVRKKYETAINDLEKVANKLQKLKLQFAELLANKEDAEEFRRNIK